MRLSPQNTRFQYETPVLGPYCRSTTASGETQKRTLFPAAKPRRHSLGIGFLCSKISDSTCFGQTGAGSGRTTERTEPADKLNKRWRKIPFKHAKPTFLKTIVSACHSVKLMPR